jgi:pyridoxal phosphate enzyme (YggS family)
MSDIAVNITSIKKRLPSNVRLVTVSKTIPDDEILIAYNTGQRCFGENRVQELLRKKEYLPGDIEWHMIGHLQSNKVKYIVPFISMIHSVDSFKLLSAINTEASKIPRVVECLFQMHIATEDTKFGFSMHELDDIISSQYFRDFKNVRICGVMGMATFTSDKAQIRKEFQYLAGCFKVLKNRYFEDSSYFREISCGMSGDFEIALEEGSTMVRIGSHIFGERKSR